MNRNGHQDDFPEVQAAIYGLALSLDSLLVNSIPNGVIDQGVFGGLLQKTADKLLEELASLEQYAPHAPANRQPKVMEVLGSLRASCQQLIDLAMGLRTFKTLPIQQLRSTVSRIPALRTECVQRLQELEVCFETPKSFSQTRPSHSTRL